jgi:hypothetical protein
MIEIIEKEFRKILESLRYNEVLLDGELYCELERICYEYNIHSLCSFETLGVLYSRIYKIPQVKRL